jgi:hypothetical protein
MYMGERDRVSPSPLSLSLHDTGQVEANSSTNEDIARRKDDILFFFFFFFLYILFIILPADHLTSGLSYGILRGVRERGQRGCVRSTVLSRGHFYYLV